jgi:hypothetical protein
MSVCARIGFTASSPQYVSDAGAAITSDLDFDHTNLDLEDGGRMFPRKIYTYLQHYTASQSQHLNPCDLRFSQGDFEKYCRHVVWGKLFRLLTVLPFETLLKFCLNI